MLITASMGLPAGEHKPNSLVERQLDGFMEKARTSFKRGIFLYPFVLQLPLGIILAAYT